MPPKRIPLTVVVPMYNAVKYIQQCLDSLVNQTLKGIEIILVDDGSNDGSEKIADIYAERFPNIRVIHQECISQANAVNRGLYEAHGEYVAECDADDFVSILMYEKLYNLATTPMANGQADVVRCGFFGVWDSGRTQPNPLCVPDEYVICNPQTMPRDAWKHILGKMCLLPAGIYRRKFLIENGIFWREDGQNYEDTNVEFKIRTTARDYRSLNEVLYYYRRGNEGSGSATIKDEFAICEQYEETERWLKAHGNEQFMEFFNARRFYDYMWSLKRIPAEENERKVDFVLRMMDDFREHPATPEFFNSPNDFRGYCLIKYGAWTETGVSD